MAKIKQLERYTAASKAVADFKDKHAKIFAQFDGLLIEAGDAEAELKTYVKENVKGNIANDFVKVTYSPAFKKFYDVEVVLEAVTPKMKKAILDAGALTQSIDSAKFEELVEKGQVSVEIKQEAFREVEQAPRVSIKEVK